MKLTGKIGMTLTLLILMAGCGQKVDHHGKTPLVNVGNDYLYEEELMEAMPVGLKGADSAEFVQSYIRGWIEDALLFDKAEGNIPVNNRIDELVSSYRRALITHTYEEELVRQKLGAEITDEEVEAYYDTHTDIYLASQPYIQGLFLKVPLGAAQVSDVRQWYKKSNAEALDKIEKFSMSAAVSYEYFYDRWLPVSDLSARLPLKALETDPSYLDHNRNVEVKDDAYHYFLHVEDFLPAGEKVPLEYAKSEIKNILINLKRVEFIKRIKEDLYRKASERNDITYYKQ